MWRFNSDFCEPILCYSSTTYICVYVRIYTPILQVHLSLLSYRLLAFGYILLVFKNFLYPLPLHSCQLPIQLYLHLERSCSRCCFRSWCCYCCSCCCCCGGCSFDCFGNGCCRGFCCCCCGRCCWGCWCKVSCCCCWTCCWCGFRCWDCCCGFRILSNMFCTRSPTLWTVFLGLVLVVVLDAYPLTFLWATLEYVRLDLLYFSFAMSFASE